MAVKQKAEVAVQENQDAMMMKRQKKLKVKPEHQENQGT